MTEVDPLAVFTIEVHRLVNLRELQNNVLIVMRYMHWRVPFIRDPQRIVQVLWQLTFVMVKNTLRVSLLKVDRGNAQMAGCLDVAWWLSEQSHGYERSYILMRLGALKLGESL